MSDHTQCDLENGWNEIIHTLRGAPQRVVRWVEIARQEAEAL